MDLEAPSSPPPSYTSIQSNRLPRKRELSNEEKFRNIITKYNISEIYAEKLKILRKFKIVFIFDDSSSMREVLHDSPLNSGDNQSKVTRWDELIYFSNISIEIASVFNPKGCDVYFLNRYRMPIRNITDPREIEFYFHDIPDGYTPLTNVFQSVLQNNPESSLNDEKLLIIIVTDGEPSNINVK